MKVKKLSSTSDKMRKMYRKKILQKPTNKK